MITRPSLLKDQFQLILWGLVLIAFCSCQHKGQKAPRKVVDETPAVTSPKGSVFNLPDEVFQDPDRVPWMNPGFIDSVQILLTNDYVMETQSYSGASAFLVSWEDKVYLCTAKHLVWMLTKDDTFYKTDSVNDILKYWRVYPRHDRIAADTLYVKRLINEDLNEDDILFFELKDQTHSIQPLKPKIQFFNPGDKLFVIGCQYNDAGCHQRLYPVEYYKSMGGFLYVKATTGVDFRGFSGAPVLDLQGYVVGVASHTHDEDGLALLGIEGRVRYIGSYLDEE